MEAEQFILILKKRKKVVFFAVLLFLAAAAVITFTSTLDYRAEARILIVQNYSGNTPPDPYVVSQANKYLTGVLTQVVGSDAFYEQTIAGGFNFDKSFFPGELSTQLAKWKRTVEAFAANDSGIIDIRTYHPDRYQAEQLAQAVVYTIKENHASYHSSGEKVSLKVIDQPLVSNYPVRPDLFLTFSLAFILGIAFGFFYIYIFSYPLEKYLPQNPAQNQSYQAYYREVPPANNLQPIEPYEPEPAYQPAPPVRQYAAPQAYAGQQAVGQTMAQPQAPRPDQFNAYQQRPEYMPQPEQISPSQYQSIGRGDMRNVLGHKGL